MKTRKLMCLIGAALLLLTTLSPALPALAADEYTLTIDVVGNGSVVTDPDQTTYDEGTVVSLTATPESGWEFSEWSGDLSSDDNPADITMDGNKTVTATFTEIPPTQHTLTVNIAGSGSVSRNPNQSTYDEGTVVHLTAMPYTGWQFSGWSGDLDGSDNPADITMDGDKTVTATFTEIPAEEYTLTVNIVGDGNVTKNPDRTAYSAGSVVELTAVAVDGWVFAGWSGDLSGDDNPTHITMDGDKTVTAVFTEIPAEEYTLNINIGGSGTVTKDPNQVTYSEGTSVQLTATPAADWSFQGWTGNLSGTENPATIVMDGNKNVSATFTPGYYTLSVTTRGSGGVSVEPDNEYYNPGDEVIITATPTEGWTFCGWSGYVSGTTNPVTFTMDDNRNVTATFAHAATPAPAKWWQASWSRRAEVTITETAATNLANYQVMIHIPYSPYMQTDFSDIRFVDVDNATELSCWRQNVDSAASADFWVKVPYIPASGTAKIYMYYGNPSAETASDIHSTFIWADDFQDADWTYNNTNYINYDSPVNGDPSEQYIEDGVFHQLGEAASEPIAEMFSGGSMKAFPPDYVVDVDLNPVIKYGNSIICPRYRAVNDKYESLMNIQFNAAGLNKVVVNVWEPIAAEYAKTINTGIWYKLTSVISQEEDNNRIKILIDDVQYINRTDPSLKYTGLSLITYDHEDSCHVAYDNFRVREYATIEPTSAIGTEQGGCMVTTGAAADITDTSATISGSLESLGVSASVPVSFEWGLTSDYGNTTPSQVMTETGTFSYTLTDLDPNMTYHFRAKAGEPAVFGTDATFITGKVPPAVSTSAASALNSNSATLNGSLTNLGDAESVSVSFEWGLDLSYGNMTDAVPMSAIGDFSTSVSGLPANTTHYFRAKAEGKGVAYGSVVSFTTSSKHSGGGGGGGGGQDKTPPRISEVTVSNINRTSADIYWKTQEKCDSQVEYRASPSVLSELDEEMVTEHHVTLTGLNPAKTYYYKTMSRDKAGNLTVSDEYTFTTKGTPATFTLESLEITPTEVEIGETVTITVTVINSGDADGDHVVTLEIGGLAIASKTVTLAGGASERVTFTALPGSAGTCGVTCGNLSGTFVVKETPVESVFSQEPPSPPVAEEPEASPVAEEPEASVSWWPIGALIAGITLVSLGVYLYGRRRARA